MNEYWRSHGFRVWTMREGEDKPSYEMNVFCSSLDQAGPVLHVHMPLSWMLEDSYKVIELHYDLCGNPMTYVPERVKFRCHNALKADWQIVPMDAMHPEDKEIVRYYAHYHCTDIEWVNAT